MFVYRRWVLDVPRVRQQNLPSLKLTAAKTPLKIGGKAPKRKVIGTKPQLFLWEGQFESFVSEAENRPVFGPSGPIFTGKAEFTFRNRWC